MIDIIKQTPSIYSEESRDYQVLARLYTALFNYNKMYIDNLRVWNENIDNKLSDLRAKTLGFFPRRKWDKSSLEAISTCFKYLEINKGTIEALKYCIIILIRINNLEGTPIISTPDKYGNIKIKIPVDLSSLGIVEDLFDYLIPAGLTYRIYTYISTDTTNSLTISPRSTADFKEYEWDKFGIYDGTSEGTSVNHQGYLWYKNNIIGIDSQSNNSFDIV